MDQARWMVVCSVVICMIAALTLLQRYAVETAAPTAPLVALPEVVEKAVMAAPDNSGSEAAISNGYSQIRFSKPPSHVFSVGDTSEITKESESIKTSGRIL